MHNDTLQFPLPLLAYGATVSERLECAIIHATISTGIHRLAVLTPAMIEAELAGETISNYYCKGITAEMVKATMLGCQFCGVRRPESAYQVKGRFDRYRHAETFLAKWKESGLSVPWTRVPKDMAFEARDGNAKTYTRFAALCALNAAIGQKPTAIVTVNRIRAGMLGYSSGKLLFADDGSLTPAGDALLKARNDDWKLLTRSQTRTMLDNLVASGLTHRFNSYRGGLTHYSKSLSAEMIAENLLLRASRKASNPKLLKLSEAIRQAKQDGVLLCGELLPQSPHNTDSPLNREIATQSPPGSHPVATSSPHNAASNASLNASSNASVNAAHALSGKEDEKHFNAHDDWTPEQREAAFKQLREAIK